MEDSARPLRGDLRTRRGASRRGLHWEKTARPTTRPCPSTKSLTCPLVHWPSGIVFCSCGSHGRCSNTVSRSSVSGASPTRRVGFAWMKADVRQMEMFDDVEADMGTATGPAPFRGVPAGDQGTTKEDRRRDTSGHHRATPGALTQTERRASPHRATGRRSLP